MKSATCASALRRGPSAAFHPVFLQCGNHDLNILDHHFRVSDRGMTFKTDSYFAPFTTLSIRLQIPPAFSSLKGKTIQCEGVVVECRGSHERRSFQVTVAFLNLTAANQKQLAIADRILAESVQPVRDS